MKLTGKVVLITHVSEFMGPALTEEFAREGATLALHDLTEAAARPAVRIAEGHGRTAVAFGADLTRSEECDRLVRSVVDRFGALDILLNNNAWPATGSPADEATDEAWRDMLTHLLDEPFFCLRAALRVMKAQKRGKIINLTSAVGLVGLANYAAYTAARAAVNGLTKAVGREVARHGIQVNAIAQNYVENPAYFPPSLTRDPEKLSRMVRNIPARRLARGEESARLAVYLASEDADFFVGSFPSPAAG